jgi:hypothetical protein
MAERSLGKGEADAPILRRFGLRRSLPGPNLAGMDAPATANFLRPALAGAAATCAGNGLARFAYVPLFPAMVVAGWVDGGGAGLLGAAALAGYLAGVLGAGRVARAARGGGHARPRHGAGGALARGLRVERRLRVADGLALRRGRRGRAADGAGRAGGAGGRRAGAARRGGRRGDRRRGHGHRGGGAAGAGAAAGGAAGDLDRARRRGAAALALRAPALAGPAGGG